MSILIVMVVLFAVMWLFMIRPQRRRQAAQQALLSQVAPGDEVITAGGLYGVVQDVDEDTISLEIAPGTNVKLARRAIATVLRDDLDEDEVLDEEDELDGEPLDPEAEVDEGPEPEPAEATRR